MSEIAWFRHLSVAAPHNLGVKSGRADVRAQCRCLSSESSSMSSDGCEGLWPCGVTNWPGNRRCA